MVAFKLTSTVVSAHVVPVGGCDTPTHPSFESTEMHVACTHPSILPSPVYHGGSGFNVRAPYLVIWV